MTLLKEIYERQKMYGYLYFFKISNFRNLF